MQKPTVRYRDNAFVNLETGEIVDRLQMLRFGRATADLYAGRGSYCSNCTAKRRRRSKAWTLWAANLAANFALIAILGLVKVVIVVMGK